MMEIPIAMILASRLLPFRANRLANIIAGCLLTLVNGFLTFVLPLTNGDFREPILPAYVFFATIETVCTVYIVRLAWTWTEVEASRDVGAVGETAIDVIWCHLKANFPTADVMSLGGRKDDRSLRKFGPIWGAPKRRREPWAR